MMRVLQLGALVLSLIWLAWTTTTLMAQGSTSADLRVLESNAQRIVLELETPRPNVREKQIAGGTYLDLSIPRWGATDAPGKPRLPMRSALIAIPQHAQVKWKILADHTRAETLAHPVLPAPHQQVEYDPLAPLPRPLGLTFAPDAATYAQDAPYPAHLVQISDPAQWRSQRYVRLQFFPFQYNPATRTLITHTRLRVELDFGLPPNAPAQDLGAWVDEGGFEPIFRSAFVNYDLAKNWRTARSRAQAVSPAAGTPSGTAYKIAVNQDGIVRVTCAQLARAGLNLADLALDTLRLTLRGVEVALAVEDANGNNRCDTDDGLLFFGQAANTEFTDTNIYWLTFGSAAGKRMTWLDGSGTATTPHSFSDTLHLEQNKFYVGYIPYVEEADHWYWLAFPHPYDPDGNGDPNSVDLTLNVSNLDPAAGHATLRVALAAFSTGEHHTQLSVNGTLVAEQLWSGRTTQIVTTTFPSSWLHEGANTLRVADALPYPNFVYVNYAELDYARIFHAVNDVLRFRQDESGAWEYLIGGFSTADVQVFDITDPYNVARVTAAVTSGASYTARFMQEVTAPREYLVLTRAQFIAPQSITADVASDLRDPNNGADYILITDGGWIPNVQPLAAWRASQGWRVKIIDIQDVFDEFNYGLIDPRALRDFLAQAYDNWQPPKPSFVLLAGNGHYDYKNYLGTNEPNPIPPLLKLVDPWIGMTASDHRLVNLDPGSPLPSMAIGRLPAISAADLDAIITKILNYEQHAPSGNWRKRVTFFTDNGYYADGSLDPAGNFYELSDQVAGNPDLMPAPMITERIYYNPCATCPLPYPTYGSVDEARTALLAAINDGRLIVNYIGHSAIYQWGSANEGYLRNTDASALTNGTKPPLMLPMTCYDGFFHMPNLASISEALVRQADGGAIASFAPTGLGVATGHDFLDRGFFEAVMPRGVTRVGPAAVFAKAKLYAESGGANLDLIDTFNLLGDPATSLALPAERLTPTPTPSATPTPTRTPRPSRTVTAAPTPTETATPGGECLDKPGKFALVAPANGESFQHARVWLEWSAATCAVRYRVLIKQDSKSGKLADRATLFGETRYRTKVLERGHAYWWRVKACNAHGCRTSKWRMFLVEPSSRNGN